MMEGWWNIRHLEKTDGKNDDDSSPPGVEGSFDYGEKKTKDSSVEPPLSASRKISCVKKGAKEMENLPKV